jgi:hypothetical protein
MVSSALVHHSYLAYIVLGDEIGHEGRGSINNFWVGLRSTARESVPPPREHRRQATIVSGLASRNETWPKRFV